MSNGARPKLPKEHYLSRLAEKGYTPSDDSSPNSIAHQRDQLSKSKPKPNRSKVRSNSPIKSSTVKTQANVDILQHIKQYWSMPIVTSDEEALERINFYLDDCESNMFKPTIEGVSLVMGISTSTFRRWCGLADDNEPFSKYSLCKKFRQILADFDAQSVISGEMNTVAYIFRAKNFYGMKDQVENVVKVDDPLGDRENPEKILAKVRGDIIDAEVNDGENDEK